MEILSSRALEDRVNAIAARQHGVVTHAQLADAGMSRSSCRHRVVTGRLRRLHRGVYAVGPIVLPHARQMAAVLACGRGALLSHDDARSLWLEATSPARYDPVQNGAGEEAVSVTVAHTGRSRRPGIRLHRVRRIDSADWTVQHGIPVTTPIRTVLDLAPVIGASQLEQLIARLARERLLDLDELATRVAICRGRKGVPTLRAVLEQSGGPALTRSEAEAVFLALLRKAGLPAPEVNVRVGAYELDFYWRDERLAVEIDGFRHHSSRPRFEGDRRKDTWLRARGLSVIRLSWRQITQEAMATAVQVGQALMHGAR
jgi:very-short-patch-repair endonuclease